MNLAPYDYYLVLDLEATCCNQETIKRHEMEIIESRFPNVPFPIAYPHIDLKQWFSEQRSPSTSLKLI